jgi:hypothetical protein
MRLSRTLLGVFAISGLLACAKPAARKEPPAETAAQSETSESPDVQQDATQDSDRERLAAEDALSDAREAMRNAEDTAGKEKQRQAYRDIHTIGTAIAVWLSDHPAEGSPSRQETQKSSYDPNDCPLISHNQLEALLTRYISKVPETDPWGHSYELRLKVNDTYSNRIFMIRSPGRDGVYDTEPYVSGAFDPNDLDQDLVFADDFMIRWPKGVSP